MSHNETIINPKGPIMETTETPDVKSEYFEIRINKSFVKKIATVTAATAAVVVAVFVAKNLSVETSEDSVTVELENPLSSNE